MIDKKKITISILILVIIIISLISIYYYKNKKNTTLENNSLSSEKSVYNYCINKQNIDEYAANIFYLNLITNTHLNETIEYCKNNFEIPEYCEEFINAIRFNKSDNCEKIKNISSDFEKKEVCIALALKDKNYCEKITDISKKDTCEARVMLFNAIETNNKSICYQIKKIDETVTCLYYFDKSCIYYNNDVISEENFINNGW